jgi:hypothetical protein
MVDLHLGTPNNGRRCRVDVVKRKKINKQLRIKIKEPPK